MQLVLLRSEIPSGMCAKLRTVAASNNRDHPTRSLYYCLFAPCRYVFVLRAHPVRGESYIQRNTTGEVATVPTRAVEPEPKNFEWWSRSLKFEFPFNRHILCSKPLVQNAIVFNF